ncbi:MAG: hypothetical protein KDA41_07865 [Planctomycetales bacterium]|nr:hypothetical protein [Planctomycetales bacterium]
MTRRRWFGAALGLACCCGCVDSPSEPAGVDLVWGERGVADGRLQKPRAIAIDGQDRLYIVDMTARIQVFDADGNFLRAWRTPAWANGKPSGLSIANDGNLLVADTHYFRMLVYTPEGKLLPDRTIGGECGLGPGQFGFVTDAVQDSTGAYYIAEYGEFDRIQKFSPTGKFLFQWGGHSQQPGEFMRPNSLAVDSADHLWVADACNHRIQVFDATGDAARLIKIWGTEGTAVGQMRYPYDLVLDGQGHVYVSEFGNHRVQKFTLDGRSLGCFGGPGRQPGQMYQPWALAADGRGRLHVLDSYNHRVQRIKM